MWVTITGIKSEKTKNKIVKNFEGMNPKLLKVSGSTGNYQVRIATYGANPAVTLTKVVNNIWNLTPEHMSNLTWKVSSR